MKQLMIATAAAGLALTLGLGTAMAQTAEPAKPKVAVAKAPGKVACIKAKGTATMVTEDLAKFMSGAAAKNSAKAWGGPDVKLGPVTHKCDGGLPFSCDASLKACK